MTIKAWNNLTQSKKEKVVNVLGDIENLDSYSRSKLACNYIASTAKLRIQQKQILEITKLLPNGDVEINIKIVV